MQQSNVQVIKNYTGLFLSQQLSSEKRPYEKETSVDFCGKFRMPLLYNTELQKLG